jgi:hypothetical protein
VANAVKIVSWRAAEVTGLTARELERRMARVGALIETDSKRLAGRSQERVRTKSGRFRGLAPSLPGEPPKIVSGVLRNSIAHQVIPFDGSVVRAILFVLRNVKYARRLELGFQGVDSAGRNVSQAPRPFLRPTILRNHARIRAILGAR